MHRHIKTHSLRSRSLPAWQKRRQSVFLYGFELCYNCQACGNQAKRRRTCSVLDWCYAIDGCRRVSYALEEGSIPSSTTSFSWGQIDWSRYYALTVGDRVRFPSPLPQFSVLGEMDIMLVFETSGGSSILSGPAKFRIGSATQMHSTYN
jgi:hypothetical protein